MNEGQTPILEERWPWVILLGILCVLWYWWEQLIEGSRFVGCGRGFYRIRSWS